MDWHDDVSAALPTAGPEGEGELRADLADEIADHLECAMQRERMHEEDETTARDRVLERFGDPRAVIRQLWFDAIRERLVGQRITMIAAVVLAVASLATCGLAWSIASGVQRTNAELLAKSDEANRKLLELLAERPEPVAVAAPAPVSLDWNPTTIELVEEGTGEPIEGWSVRITGHLHTETEEASVSEQTGEDGRADMGLVRPGRHRAHVISPWNESTSRSFTVRPGREEVLRIECPPLAPPERTVELEFDVPHWEMFRDDRYGVLFTFGRQSRQIGSWAWYDATEYAVLLHPDGSVLRFPHTRSHSSNTVELYGEPTTLEDRRITLPTGTYEPGSVKFVQIQPETDVPLQEVRSLEIVSPSAQWSRVSSRTFPGGRLSFDNEPTVAVPFELPEGEGVTTWTLPVPPTVTAVAWATSTSKRLNDGSEHRTSSEFLNLVRFSLADTGLDGQLNVEEYDEAFGSPRTPKPSEEIEAEWPLDVTTYLAEVKRTRAVELERVRGLRGRRE